MAVSPQRITPLPDDVRAQLSSSIDITCHEQVVTGLLENAFDAKAQSIAIHMDLARGYFSVLDDGIGIHEVEFSEGGRLGEAHCKPMGPRVSFNMHLLIKCSGTSKSESLFNTYGQFGRFLSCLSVIALLSITSRHKSDTHASRLILHRGHVVHRKLRLDDPGFEIGRSGTKIEVHNLFGDIPVRSRYMYDRFSSTVEIERAFDLLRGILTGYLLACSGQIDLYCTLNGTSRRLVHRRSSTSKSATQLPQHMVVAILSQTRPGSAFDSTNWRSASVRTSKYFINAVISIEPAPSPANQYITIGKIPIHAREDHGLFFKTVNHRFQASNFGQDSDLSRSKNTDIMPLGVLPRNPAHSNTPKRVDRWPMFYIQVNGSSDREARQLSQEEVSFALKEVGHPITRALESLVSHFLTAEGFEPASKKTASQRFGRSRQSLESHKALPILEAKTPKLVHMNTASQLSHWHRVKSGHSKATDIDYGLPFAKSASSHYTQAELARDIQLLSENLDSDEIDLDTPVSGGSLVRSDEGGSCESPSHDTVQKYDLDGTRLWTNPHTGHTIHIHTRTGATISDGQPLLNTAKQVRSQATLSATNLQARTPGLHISDSSNLVRPGGGRALNLKPYVEAHLIRRESPIAIVGQAESVGLDEKASSPLFQGSNQVSKEDLSRAKVLGQVDKKFILITVKNLLILIDQHAADERVKLEQLCQESCVGDPIILAQPLVFEIELDEASLFLAWQAYFRKWKIDYVVEECQSKELRQGQGLRHRDFSIKVNALPRLIAERCRAEPKLLIELLRHELWSHRVHSKLDTCSLSAPQSQSRRSWLSIAASCPIGVLELLKSRSCRTAIMFNDILDMDECEELVRRLTECDLPFQCAHGRPTLTVLTDFGLLNNNPKNSAAEAEALGYNTIGFGAAWQKWSSGS